MLNNVPGLVAYVGSDGRYKFVNRHYAEWFGKPESEILGKCIADAVDPEAWAQIATHVEQALSGESVVFEGWRRYRPDHPLRFVKVTFLPDFTSQSDGTQPAVAGFAVLVEDLTEQKRAQDALAESEQRYKAIIEATSTYIWRSEADSFDYLADSQWWTELTGQSAEDLRRSGWIKMLHPDDRERVSLQCAKAIAEQSTLDTSYRLLTCGGYREYSVRGVPVRRADGSVREWVGTLTDITKKRGKERALRESERRYRTLFNVTKEGIAILDDQNRIVDANPGLCRILKRPREELIGACPVDLSPVDRMKEAQAGFESLMAGGDKSVIIPMRAKDGSVVELDSRCERHFLPGLSLCSCHDVTELKRSEAALRRANSELEQFAYSAAHDLREPIRNIAIYSELLESKIETCDVELKFFLEIINRGARHLDALVSDLLTYIQAGHLSAAESEPVDPNAVISDCLTQLSHLVEGCAAEVSCGPIPRLRVARVHLEQVFQNLLSNALKYRSEARPKIEVGATISERGVVISFADNGVGIPLEHRERIFGLFRRLYGSDEYEGTGIGLALCKKIVERYDGRIWVESSPGKGSVFHVSFPSILVISAAG